MYLYIKDEWKVSEEITEVALHINEIIEEGQGRIPHLRTFENADNIRIADPNNSEDVLKYNEKKDRGCCGDYDDLWINPKTGKTWMIGFNYGH